MPGTSRTATGLSVSMSGGVGTGRGIPRYGTGIPGIGGYAVMAPGTGGGGPG